MAIVIDYDAQKYLERKQEGFERSSKSNRVLHFAGYLMLVVGFFAVLGESLVGWILLVLGVGVTVGAFISSDFSKVRVGHYKKGGRGEDYTRSELSKLPNEYIVYCNVMNKRGGNIDFIVIAPNMAFVIENKDYPGHITWNGVEILYNGYPKGDVIRQVNNQRQSATDFIHFDVKRPIPIEFMVSFSSYYANLDYSAIRLRDPRLILSRNLVRYILSNFPNCKKGEKVGVTQTFLDISQTKLSRCITRRLLADQLKKLGEVYTISSQLNNLGHMCSPLLQ